MKNNLRSLGIFLVLPFVMGCASAPRYPEVRSAKPIQPNGEIIQIKLNQDLVYEGNGFPWGMAAGQTAVRVTNNPFKGIQYPTVSEKDKAYYGRLEFGNSPEKYMPFMLVKKEQSSELYLDKNQNQDLNDDGDPAGNEGTFRGDSGIFAGNVQFNYKIKDSSDKLITQPYTLWIWFTKAGSGIKAFMYSKCHLRGSLALEKDIFELVAFERFHHNGMYNDGVCVDFNKNRKCDIDQEVLKNRGQLDWNNKTYSVNISY